MFNPYHPRPGHAASNEQEQEEPRRRLDLGALVRWGGGWLLLMVTVAAAYRSVHGFDLLGQARALILDNRYLQDLDFLAQNLRSSYLHAEGSDAYLPTWRPLPKVSWMLEYQLFGTWAGGYHLVSLGWHLVATSAVFVLARLGLGLSIGLALAAGALFGLHPVAIEPVCMVDARPDVMLVAGVTWAVAGCWLWARRGGVGWFLLHLLGMVVALGSKEAAVVAAPICALAAVLGGKPRGWRLLGLLPAMLLTAAYIWLRSLVLDPGASQVPLSAPLAWAVGWSSYLVNLLPFLLESTVRDLNQGELGTSAAQIWAAAAGAALAGLATLGIWRKDRSLLCLLLWILLAAAVVLLPAAVLVPVKEGKVPLSDRWLYLALPAAALLWPRLVALINRRPAVLVFLVGTLIWSGSWLVLAPRAHGTYADEAGLLDLADWKLEQIPEELQTPRDRCGFNERQLKRLGALGKPDRLITLAAQTEQACGFDRRRTRRVMAALIRAGRFREADPLGRRLLRQSGDDTEAAAQEHFLAGRVALKLGEAHRALTLLERSVLLGLMKCAVFQHVGEAAVALERYDRAALAAEQQHRCTGSPAPPMLLLAAERWLADGQPRRARQLLPNLKAMFPMVAADRKRFEALEANLDAAGK